MKRSFKTDQSGVTLVELLAALSLLTIVTASAFLLLSTGLNVATETEETSSSRTQYRIAASEITDAIQSGIGEGVVAQEGNTFTIDRPGDALIITYDEADQTLTTNTGVYLTDVEDFSILESDNQSYLVTLKQTDVNVQQFTAKPRTRLVTREIDDDPPGNGEEPEKCTLADIVSKENSTVQGPCAFLNEEKLMPNKNATIVKDATFEQELEIMPGGNVTIGQDAVFDQCVKVRNGNLKVDEGTAIFKGDLQLWPNAKIVVHGEELEDVDAILEHEDITVHGEVINRPVGEN
ncbi:PilW family protein [Texcoconibacillus texcoconensis]|uniref:Prepilin-type N-terminal cleavage/methylation domain-containing protein n=1 Tax=Texcoconibacillus texcoconensis TaxID=1095777 RepID=A0A840QS10_9BACI|nr:type II secretion system protein [Texcoconibacillus texcoconensis]MBB5174108.1 prepilin-type N-terminal cleavage/methylation domain-containing protein [Texcoconibacillus texcoconensis]